MKTVIVVAMLVLQSISAFGQDNRRENWWEKMNGCRMYYLQFGENTFKKIEADLDNLYDKGYRIISFYCIHDGDRRAYAGLGPYDYYSAQRTAGSLADFESLSSAVHAKGMKMLTWMNLGYSNPEHSYWQKAERDKRDEIDSQQARSFIWSDTKMEPGDRLWGWGYSETAECWYKKSWGYPGFNWAEPAWQNEAKRILDFWMDRGIDGFVVDAAEFYEEYNGASKAILKQYIGDTVSGRNCIAVPEGSTPTPEWSSERNFSHSYDNDDDTASHDRTNMAWDAIDTHDPNVIENHLKESGDGARALGGGTFSYDPETRHRRDHAKRPLEVAIMTSVGVLYELWFSCQRGYGEYTDEIENVLRAVNSTPALELGGSRARLPNDQSTVYSIMKRSVDGTRCALCVFNLGESSVEVTVSLSGSGIRSGQYPKDLLTGENGIHISSEDYVLALPAFGFALYEVDIDAALTVDRQR